MEGWTYNFNRVTKVSDEQLLESASMRLGTSNVNVELQCSDRYHHLYSLTGEIEAKMGTKIFRCEKSRYW